MANPKVEKVAQESLFVSEPPPSWFGNGPNPSDPKRSNFGVVRVLNDDLVQPDRGFGTHPHRNMEIVTYIVQGKLTHQDSMGTKETLGRGSIQFMTAGTGVRHSEHNLDTTTPLRFLQIWIVPNKMGLPVNYGSYDSKGDEPKNSWRHLVSDVKTKDISTPVKINQDCNIFVTELEAGKTLQFDLKANRQAYGVLIEGSAQFQESKTHLVRHDALKMWGAASHSILAGDSGAHMLILEMAQQ